MVRDMQNETLKKETDIAFDQNALSPVYLEDYHSLFRSQEWKRRKKSVQATYPFVEEELNERYGKNKYMTPEAVWAKMEACNFFSLSDTMIPYTKKYFETAAIWVADRILDAGKMEDCIRLIGTLNEEDVKADDYSLKDSVHLDEVKNGIAYILRHRDDNGSGRWTPKEMIANKAAIEGKHKNSPNRKRYNELIALIPEEDIEELKKYYDEEIRDIALELIDEVESDIRKTELAMRATNNAAEQSVNLGKLIGKTNKNSRGDIFSQIQPQPNALLTANTVPLRTNEDLFANEEQKLRNVFNNLNIQAKSLWNMTTKIANYRFKQHLDNASIEGAADGNGGNGHICKDPYAIVFATLYLADEGYDVTFSSEGVCLFYAAEVQLPWIYDLQESTKPKAQQQHTDITINKDILSQIYDEFYDNKYLNISCSEGEDGEAEENFSYANPAQVIYYVSGHIPPRNNTILASMDTDLDGVVIDNMDSTSMDKALSVAGVLSERKNAEYEKQLLMQMEAEKDTQTEQRAKDLSDEVARLNKIVAEQKKKIDELKGSTYQVTQIADDLSHELEETRAVSEKYRKELAEMRDVVFSMSENSNSDPDEDVPESDRNLLPYCVKRKTLVFGGNNSWVKRVKQNISGNIRFFERNGIPNEEAIKNADVVWIQTFSISHSEYYKIINTAATSPDVEVHFFPSHGIVASAINIAKLDAGGGTDYAGKE